MQDIQQQRTIYLYWLENGRYEHLNPFLAFYAYRHFCMRRLLTCIELQASAASLSRGFNASLS